MASPWSGLLHMHRVGRCGFAKREGDFMECAVNKYHMFEKSSTALSSPVRQHDLTFNLSPIFHGLSL